MRIFDCPLQLTTPFLHRDTSTNRKREPAVSSTKFLIESPLVYSRLQSLICSLNVVSLLQSLSSPCDAVSAIAKSTLIEMHVIHFNQSTLPNLMHHL